MRVDQEQAPRDYGGWRLRRGIGLFGLGAGGTVAVLAALLWAMHRANISRLLAGTEGKIGAAAEQSRP